MSIQIPLSVRSWFVVALSLLSLVFTHEASASGRVEWKSKTFKEREDKAWRLEVAIFLPRAPDVPHVPMKFEFQPEVYYERDLVDGSDKPQEHKVPLINRQALIESVDVGFLDSGTGKIESRTRFSFKLTRAHGYEAGEYKVSIHDGRNDQAVGAAVTLTFDGENEVIDRRAMVFSGGDKKKDAAKADDAKSDDSSGGDAKKSATDKPEDDADAPRSDADQAKEPAPSEEPQTIKEKPGGCGCRLAQPAQGGGVGLGSSAFALIVTLFRRRRRRPSDE